MSSAPTVTATITGSPCPLSGTYDITYTLDTTGTATTWNLNVAFHSCKESDGSVLAGSLAAVHTQDTASSYDRAAVTADLSVTAYSGATSTVVTGIAALSGTFESIDSSSTGTNSAKGSFTWTIPGTGGNSVYAFTFGSGSTPVTDVWSRSTGTSGSTETHTGNGAYTLSLSTPSQSLGLTVALANLQDKVFTASADSSTDEWINGAVTLTWTPDLSQWGCLAGTYTFSTATGTPVHTPHLYSCPTSGTVQVNNATIEFGKPSGTQVTVTVGTLSETFSDCNSLGGGLCN
jgi:hypothetical protein